MDPQEMTVRDWYSVLEGTSAATSLIVVSDMSGPLGLVKETSASLEPLRADSWKTPFMAAFRTAVLEASKEQQQEFMTIAKERQAELQEQRPTKEQTQEMALATIRNAVALVESKAGPEAASEYRQLAYQMAVKAAEAGKEGGFLGIGGTLVSGKEKAALDQVKEVLGL